MSIRKSFSCSGSDRKVHENASRSSGLPPQQASSRSSSLDSQLSVRSSSGYLPEEYKTWSRFKQNHIPQSSTPATLGPTEIEERITETKQAQLLISEAINALQRKIESRSSSTIQDEEQRNTNFRLMKDLIDEKECFDENLALLNAMWSGSGSTQRQCSDKTGLDDNTIKIVASLDEDYDQVYAERRRNRQLRRRGGLVDGVQILDDYTLATIDEFNREKTRRVHADRTSRL